MGWMALITLLAQIFGPLIAKLIERWLSPASKKVKEPESFAAPQQATDALFDRAIADAKGLGSRPKRALLRVAKRLAAPRAEAVFAKASGDKVTIPKLTKSERAELADAFGMVG